MRPGGRTRRRRRKKKLGYSACFGVNHSHEHEYIELKKWLKHRGFEDNNLKTAYFPDTGRGLMATKSLQVGRIGYCFAGEMLADYYSSIGKHLGWKPPVSPLLALCTYLIAERHAGWQSPWKPYLDVLPKTYSCPVYWEQNVVNLLPGPLRQKAMEQKTAVQELYSSSAPFFSSLQSFFPENVGSILTYEALRWAWCAVNTRTVYMKHPHRDCFSAEVDVYALAPYLDLLNHSPKVQVEAGFNEESRCYEIRTGSGCRRYEQVFICYGPHDSQRLLLEYGFAVAGNPHSTVHISTEMIVQHISDMDKQRTKKLSILKEHGFLENMTFGLDGPSWKLLVALKLLCLAADEFMCWKKVIIGEIISDSNEEKAVKLATRICVNSIDETYSAIAKISLLKGERPDLDEQLALVEALRSEDLTILQASLDMLQRMKFTSE